MDLQSGTIAAVANMLFCVFLGESLVTGAALRLTVKSDLCQDIFALELIHKALKPQTATPFLNGYASRHHFLF